MSYLEFSFLIQEFQRLQFYDQIKEEFLNNIKLTSNDESLEKWQMNRLISILVDDLFEQLNIPIIRNDIDEDEKNIKIKNEQEWTFVTAMFVKLI